MIQLKITHLGHSSKLTFPAKYERVALALWTIGLDRDPEKYTLRRLGAEFSSTTEEESQMIRLIDPGNTLMQALCLLSEMMYPPYPVAERIHKKMAAGGYASEEDFFIEMESYIYDSDLHLQRYNFPVSGEVVDKRGLVRKASDPLLLKYELLISEAIHGVHRQISGSETKLFEDVDGVYQKLMAASWSVESVSGFLVGQVILFLTEPLTKDEAKSAAKKIETLNNSSFPIRLKNWSVFTDAGLLFAYMRDEDGDYSLYDSESEDDDEDQPCLCPECQARMQTQEKP
jgi:hypothetical protein